MAIENLTFPYRDLFVRLFGERVFLVGGTIRDHLLYGSVKRRRDIDLVVVGHTFEEIERKLRPQGKTNTVGRSFAVVKFSKGRSSFDISIPRRDHKMGTDAGSHKNFLVDSGPHITLEEDLARRDFTCNSIALRLQDGWIVDPFGGLRAIERRRIAMTGPETFADDPLRVLRAARFASVHGFTIDDVIYVRSKKVRLDGLSPERVQEELFRTLLESPEPSRGLREYFRLSVLEKLFDPLYRLTLTIQDAVFHPEADEFGHHTVWAHTLAAVDVAAKLARMFKLEEERTLALLLATLFHDVGKPRATRWEFKRGRMTVTSVLHDNHGVVIADEALGRLRVETRRNYPLKARVLDLIKNHHRIFDLFSNREKIGFKAIARLVRDMEGEDLLLLLLDFADRRSRSSEPAEFSELDEVSRWYLGRKEAWNITQDSIRPLVMGRDLLALGIPGGRKMGGYLKALYELQLDGAFDSKAEGLRIFRERILKDMDQGRNGKR